MSGETGKGEAETNGQRCPICGKPMVPRYRPFCSARCRDRDLLNWLDGRYAIPAQEAEADPDEAED